MTELLDEAIARIRELPAQEQDLAAEMIFAVADRHEPRYRLTPEQAEDVQRTLDGLKNRTVKILSDEEVEEMWRRLGA